MTRELLDRGTEVTVLARDAGNGARGAVFGMCVGTVEQPTRSSQPRPQATAPKPEPEPKPKTPAEIEYEKREAKFGKAPVKSGWDGSYPVVEQYLESIARDPDSVETDGGAVPPPAFLTSPLLRRRISAIWHAISPCGCSPWTST